MQSVLYVRVLRQSRNVHKIIQIILSARRMMRGARIKQVSVSHNYITKQEILCTCNAIFMHIRVTIVAVKKQ
jgi:hypothetical protein